MANLDGIIEAADAVMVARGDLGIEVRLEELPIVQRRIVKKCVHLGRKVIVATHMLESMTENPVPTRAEVTDVANAAYEGSGRGHAQRRDQRRQVPDPLRRSAGQNLLPRGAERRR